MANPPPGSPLGADRPTVAYIQLTNGKRIHCTILEKPDLNDHGNRVFDMIPDREIMRGETIDHCYTDMLPPKTTVEFAVPRWAFPVEPTPHVYYHTGLTDSGDAGPYKGGPHAN